jgi:Mce-associated membrane protein
VRNAELSDDDGAPIEADPPISLADAERAVSQAESRAEEARARAAELRRQAEADTDDEPARLRRWLRSLPWRVRPPNRKTVGVSAATVLVAASLLASGYLLWQHISLMHEQRRAIEFEAAARRGVEMMLSIDPDHARENVQRSIDNTTGALQSQLRVTSTFLVEDAQKAKVTTKATARDVAVESMNGDSAVMLVVAESDTTNPDKSKRPPAFWRLSVGISWDGGQPKMSKFDFVQ